MLPCACAHVNFLLFTSRSSDRPEPWWTIISPDSSQPWLAMVGTPCFTVVHHCEATHSRLTVAWNYHEPLLSMPLCVIRHYQPSIISAPWYLKKPSWWTIHHWATSQPVAFQPSPPRHFQPMKSSGRLGWQPYNGRPVATCCQLRKAAGLK